MPVAAKNSFVFYTSSDLIGLTGKRARHLKEFVEVLKTIDGSSIFCHTHQAFREYHFAKGIFTNDFAYWVAEAIHEEALAERLASLDIRDFVNIKSLREKLVEMIEKYLNEKSNITIAPKGKEFYFCKAKSIASPTNYEVWNLSEFKQILKRVGPRSLFYHFFDARLRLGRKTNDFSNWIEFSLGMTDLAREIEHLDPYLFTLDGLKQKMISLIEEYEEMESIDEILRDQTLGLIKKATTFISKIKKSPMGEKSKTAKQIINRIKTRPEQKKQAQSEVEGDKK